MIQKNLVERLIHVEKRDDGALSGELAYSGGECFDLLHKGRGTRHLLLDAHASDPQARKAGEMLNPVVLDAKPFGDGPWKIGVLLNNLTENFGIERCEDVYSEVFHAGSAARESGLLMRKRTRHHRIIERHRHHFR